MFLFIFVMSGLIPPLDILRVMRWYILVTVVALATLLSAATIKNGRNDTENRSWTDNTSIIAASSTYSIQSNDGGSMFFSLVATTQKDLSNDGIVHIRRRTIVEENLRDTVSADLSVKKINLNDCSKTNKPLFTRATIGGFYFNATRSSPSSHDGDIFAVIGIEQSSDSAKELFVFGAVLQCSATCYAIPAYTPAGTIPAKILYMEKFGTTSIQTVEALALSRNPVSNRFTFSRNGKEVGSYSYPEAPMGPPYTRERQVDVGAFIPNCQTDPASVKMEANFDAVKIQ